MNILQPRCWIVLAALAAGLPADAQVPSELYMQGVFLEADGSTPAPGAHAVTLSLFTNPAAAALTKSTNVVANNHGVADFSIADPSLPGLFQGSTNVTFLMSGGATQSFVTAPYAFHAANLPNASGNFTVWSNLYVASNATIKALTAERGGTLAAPVTVAGHAHFTNLANVTFGGGLDVHGGMLFEGLVDANYQARFTNTSAVSVFYGDTNQVVMSNATIRSSFSLITTNLHSADLSDTAPVDGFLVVWVEVRGEHTSGVLVEIGNLPFTLRYYADPAQLGQNHDFWNGATFPVPKGTKWTVGLVNAGESSSISIRCYWVPLFGNG